MSLRKQAKSGVVWTFTQQFGNQLISFIVSIFLARLLLPEEFGLIGMIAIFYSVGRGLMDSGLTQSLIRSRDLDQEDFSTVFFFNLAASVLIYLIIFFCAPLIADFYDRDILTSIIRLYCITFIIDSFSSVQRTRLTKKMDFKTQTLITIPSTLLGGIVGITLAYLDFGVWSLVWSQITTAFIGSLQLWIYSKWTPSAVFNKEKFKEHFHFGYKITLSSLLNKIFNNIYLILIGKFFQPAQVGFYTRAETMKQLPVNNISNALDKVTYPLFSGIQNDNKKLKSIYRKIMQLIVYVLAPVLIFAAVLGEPLFRFLFTEKWLPAVPYFQILCLTGILYPVQSYNLNILKVKGRSDLVLKLQVIKKALVVVGLIIGLQFGIFGILYSQLILSVINFFINSYYADKFINYPTLQQVKDISAPILLAGLCGAAVFYLDSLINGFMDILRTIIGAGAGLLIYVGLSYILKLKSLRDLKDLIVR